MGYRWFVVAVLLAFSAACGTTAVPPIEEKSRAAPAWGEAAIATTHRVEKGETLYSIAFKYGKDIRELARINGLDSRYHIYPDQVLRLEGRSHTSQPVATSRQAAQKRSQNSALSSARSTASPVSRSQKPANRTSRHSQKPHWVWPADGKLLQGFSSKRVGSKGLDIAGKAGDPVRSAAAGKVVYTGSSLKGYGNLVIIKHSEELLSAYAHNRRILVKEGAHVQPGQKIAELGASGTDRPKLHFEIRKSGKPVNPLDYLPRK